MGIPRRTDSTGPEGYASHCNSTGRGVMGLRNQLCKSCVAPCDRSGTSSGFASDLSSEPTTGHVRYFRSRASAHARKRSVSLLDFPALPVPGIGTCLSHHPCHLFMNEELIRLGGVQSAYAEWHMTRDESLVSHSRNIRQVWDKEFLHLLNAYSSIYRPFGCRVP